MNIIKDTIQVAKNTYNLQVENYKKPTPKNWKRAGKIVKYTGRIVAGLTIIPALATAWWVPLAAFILGETGDLLINLKT